MAKVKFYTNLVFGGWSPKDLETGIGGSEESLILLTRELARRGHSVDVYHNGEHGVFDGVNYKDHREFDPFERHSTFVSFKARRMLDQSVNADKLIHWTTEVEPPYSGFELKQVDKVVTISKYHTNRMKPNTEQFMPIYLGVDFEELDKTKTEKKPGTAVYSSSFDRGLEELLARWPELKKKLHLENLYITYGWDFIDRMLTKTPDGAAWKARMLELLNQEGIIQLGRLTASELNKVYWESEYWVHPLNRADAELFCITAVKAQYCGCKPIVRRLGALQETVGQFIDWDNLLGSKEIITPQVEFNKKHAQKFSLKRFTDQWEQLIS